MARRKPRIVVDTNVWISFLFGGLLSELKESVIGGEFQILFSAELLEELIEVLKRARFRKLLSSKELNELVSLLLGHVEVIEIKEKFNVCRDPKDDFLLDLCASGNADYLVTGDKDLLDLKSFRKTKILEPTSFHSLFN